MSITAGSDLTVGLAPEEDLDLSPCLGAPEPRLTQRQPHRQLQRNAGLGAGELCCVKKEGVGQPVEASRRALRFLKKAENITGLKLGSTNILWTESASSLAIRRGISALHLVGTIQGKPAYRGEEADTIDNIDPDVLAENTDFVMELLKTI